MILFLDTSALVKFFHEEEGTELVSELVNSQENDIWLFDLVRLEFLSALYRRFRNNEIDEKMLNVAIEGFEEELLNFKIEQLSQTIMQEAEDLLKKYGREYGLRTLDAMHIGCFSLISENDWFFVSSDENLCKIAEVCGFKTINPIKSKDFP